MEPLTIDFEPFNNCLIELGSTFEEATKTFVDFGKTLPYISTKITPYEEKISIEEFKPLICTQCGGSVCRNTLACNYCGTQFR